MFGNDSKPSKIYSYGAKLPGNMPLVLEQMRAAHRYRNDLVRCELDRRAAVEDTLRRLCPEVAAAQAAVDGSQLALETAVSAFKAKNAAARTRVETLEDRQYLRDLRHALKAGRATLKAARKEAFARVELREALDAVDAADLARRKALRAACTAHWGTYLSCEQSMQGCRKGAPPRFYRWDGHAKLAVQIQGGMDIEHALLGTDNRLRIVLHRQTSRKQRGEVWLRISSDGRNPVWTQVPFTYHRRLPDDCRIKWVYLLCNRIGTRVEWRVQFVVECAAGWPLPDAAPVGAVGIDLGWRLVDTPREEWDERLPMRVKEQRSVRVVRWAGSDGEDGELVIPVTNLSAWRKVERLAGIRAKMFNEAQAALVAKLALWGDWTPAWLREATVTLAQWRSTARLASLVLRWRENRTTGDAETFEALEAWRKQDKHLLDWERSQLTKTLRWRDDLYRNFVAGLRRRYHTVIVEDADWRTFQRYPLPEDIAGNEEAVREYRRMAAPGRLRQLIEEGFASKTRADSHWTTLRCSQCGYLNDANKFDAAKAVMRQCQNSACPEPEIDQDLSAALNLLACERQGAVTEVVAM